MLILDSNCQSHAATSIDTKLWILFAEVACGLQRNLTCDSGIGPSDPDLRAGLTVVLLRESQQRKMDNDMSTKTDQLKTRICAWLIAGLDVILAGKHH